MMGLVGPILVATLWGAFVITVNVAFIFIQILILKFCINLIGRFFGTILFLFVDFGILMTLFTYYNN